MIENNLALSHSYNSFNEMSFASRLVYCINALFILMFLYFYRRDYGFDLFCIGEMLTFLVSGLAIDKRLALTLLLMRNYSNDCAATLLSSMESDYFRGYVGCYYSPYFLADCFTWCC